MSIEPIEPTSAVEPPHVLDGPWWSGAVAPLQRVEAPMMVTAVDRDPRAEALGIAQHATAFIPAPVVVDPMLAMRRRRRPGT